MADKPHQKIDERLKDVHTTDLTDSRINEDFLEWLKTKGPRYLLLALIGVGFYPGVVRWTQYKVTYYNTAWSELLACALPGSCADVAGALVGLPRLPVPARGRPPDPASASSTRGGYPRPNPAGSPQAQF